MTTVLQDRLEAVAPTPSINDPMVAVTVSYPQADTAVCRVTGSVDLVTAPVLASMLIGEIHAGRPHLIINLSNVAFLDSTTLRAVLDALDSYDIDGHLAIIVDSRSETITRSEISMLSEIVDIHHDLASALRVCARASISSGGRHRAKSTSEVAAS